MTQYNTLNVKLFNSQLNKLKLEIKSNIEVTLNISSNSVILMMKITFCINCYQLIHQFVKLLKMFHQLIRNYQKLNCTKFENHEHS